MKYVDDYILFASPMAQYLKLPEDKWMTMEGSIHVNQLYSAQTFEKTPTDKFVLMYSGIIDASYGLENLIHAVSELGDGYELWISGSGVSEKKVSWLAEQCSNVTYFGYLPSRESVLAYQRSASALVNIRDPQNPASRYCFPSKLFEYMLSGKPVISTHINGIPEEYYDFLIEAKDISVPALKEAIQRAANMGSKEKVNLVQNAAAFVCNKKNNVAQAKLIDDFVTKRM